MFKSLFLPLIAVAAFIVLAGLVMQGKLGNVKPSTNKISQNPAPASQTTLKQIKIGPKSISVEVARTDAERAQGLSNRASLDPNTGMIFVFNPPATPNFWMKNTLIPLDMIWIKDGKVVGITKNVQPEPGVSDANLKLYPAPSPVNYVLEVNAGFSDQNNITVGQSLSGLEQL